MKIRLGVLMFAAGFAASPAALAENGDFLVRLRGV